MHIVGPNIYLSCSTFSPRGAFNATTERAVQLFADRRCNMHTEQVRDEEEDDEEEKNCSLHYNVKSGH